MVFLVGVDGDDRDPLRLRGVFHVLDDHGAHLARADDHHPAEVRVGAAPQRPPHPAGQPDAESRPAHKEHRQHPAHDIDGDGETQHGKAVGSHQKMRKSHIAENRDGKAGRRRPEKDLEELVKARELPHGDVKAEHREDDKADEGNIWDARLKGLHVKARNAVLFKPQDKSKPVAEEDADGVHDDLRDQATDFVPSKCHTISYSNTQSGVGTAGFGPPEASRKFQAFFDGTVERTAPADKTLSGIAPDRPGAQSAVHAYGGLQWVVCKLACRLSLPPTNPDNWYSIAQSAYKINTICSLVEYPVKK